MPYEKYILHLEGADKSSSFKAETFSAKDLVVLISSLDDAVSKLTKEQFDDDFGGLSITSMKEGSLVLTTTGKKPTMSAIKSIANNINHNSCEHLSDKVSQNIKAIMELNYKNNTILSIKDSESSDPIAVIGQSEPVTQEEKTSYDIKSATTLYGRVIEVTGVRKLQVEIKLLTSENIKFQVDGVEDAQFFGNRFGELVAVNGTATWDSESGCVTDFKYDSYLPYEETTATKSMSLLKDRYHKYFDAIEDVSRFILELREDEQ